MLWKSFFFANLTLCMIRSYAHFENEVSFVQNGIMIQPLSKTHAKTAAGGTRFGSQR